MRFSASIFPIICGICSFVYHSQDPQSLLNEKDASHVKNEIRLAITKRTLNVLDALRDYLDK